METFAAIDFETATTSPNSACALGVVLVEGGAIVLRRKWLIRPPSRRFEFTHVHGLGWSAVARAPAFGDVWPELVAAVGGARFLAAHNASFDRRVLRACCGLAGHAPPRVPFVCTLALARRELGIGALDRVAAHLGIPLRHHDPLSDAEACARIALRLLPNARARRIA